MGAVESRETSCSFCGKSSTVVGPMVEGPDDVYMCAPCLHRSKEIILAMAGSARCSFCGRDVAAMRSVEGPGDIHMCADCVDAALAIVSEHEAWVRAEFKARRADVGAEDRLS